MVDAHVADLDAADDVLFVEEDFWAAKPG